MRKTCPYCGEPFADTTKNHNKKICGSAEVMWYSSLNDDYEPVYIGWHIDHVVPLSSATTPEEVKRLCHYSNL